MATKRIPTPKPGIYPGVPMQEYLAWDAWQSSDFKAMAVSPEYAYWYRHDRPSESTAAQSFGTLAHTCLLEPEAWPPEDVKWIKGPFNRNPGKAEKRVAQLEGFEVHTPDDKDRCEALAARLHDHPVIALLLEASQKEREVSAVAECPQTGLILKARADLMIPETGQIADLKTTGRGTDRASFRRTVKAFSYWLSAPHYCETFSLATGIAFDTFLFIVSGQEAPFLPEVYQLDRELLAAGEDYMQLLRRRARRCIETGEWPHGDGHVSTLFFTSYDLAEIQGAIEQERQQA